MKKTNQKESVLQEAERLVNGEKRNDYGSATDACNDIASHWSVILKTEVTPEQVCLCMVAMKIVRECNKSKRDNVVDIAGYAAVLEKVQNGQ